MKREDREDTIIIERWNGEYCEYEVSIWESPTDNRYIDLRGIYEDTPEEDHIGMTRTDAISVISTLRAAIDRLDKAITKTSPRSLRVADYDIYTDGGATGNPGRGGWGVVVTCLGEPVREINGAADNVTNNQMEITAAIEALRLIEPGSVITIFSDSLYVVNTMICNWKRRKNHDLWSLLDKEVERLGEVAFVHTRGHNGNRWQERAHQLSMKAR